MRIFSVTVVVSLVISGFQTAIAVAPLQTLTVQDNEAISISNLEWEFYWKRFLAPRDFKRRGVIPDLKMQPVTIWNDQIIDTEKLSSFGFATYRFKGTVTTPGRRMALRLQAPLTSYRLYINGELMAESGKPAVSREEYIPSRRSATIFFTQPDSELEVIIQVANFLTHKGGLRGIMDLGFAETMQVNGMRFLAIDLFSVGLIFSIMLYHFLLYLMTRKDRSTLIFSFLALDYFFLAFFFGEQAISLFFPQLPLAYHLKLGTFFLYLLPPLAILFTTELFPNILHRYVLYGYFALALAFSVLLALPPIYFTSYNVWYYGPIGISSGLVCIATAGIAMHQRRPGALLLLLGMGFLLALAMYSVSLFNAHTIAGSFLSIGFCFFALFQSGALAHNHAALDRSNREMQLRIERSRMALATQRKQIEANLHDSLGGNLTDIKLGLEALERETLDAPTKATVRRLDKRVAGTIASLRTELLFLEDLQLAMKDFISGINLILLRRYQMTRRQVNIEISEESRDCGRLLENQGFLSEEAKLELCMIVQELCNNNLKYGKGMSTWKIEAKPNSLQLTLESLSTRTLKGKGLGHETLRNRAEKAGARFSESLSGKHYEARVWIGG